MWGIASCLVKAFSPLWNRVEYLKPAWNWKLYYQLEKKDYVQRSLPWPIKVILVKELILVARKQQHC